MPKVPKRPDSRRSASTAFPQANRRRPPHVGEAERIAERRVQALELRKKGLSYRAIARQLGVSVHSAYADVAAELLELREQTAHAAEDVRDLELARCDAMTSGLWDGVERGDPKAVGAAVRVSERRARLLGLDAPALAKTEVVTDAAVMDLAAFKEKVRRLPTETLRAYRALEDQIETLRKQQEELIG